MEPFGNKNQNWAAAQAIQQQAALMANGAQSALAAQQQIILQQSGLAGAGQRVFTGTITKMHDNFGFVDNDVFFQLNVCEGQLVPSVGDSVLVKAQYNAAMPFKWNATSVQVIMKQGQQQGSKRFSNQQQGRMNQMGGNRQSFGNNRQGNRNSTGGGILGAAPSLVNNQSMNQQRNQKRNAPPPKPKSRRSPVRRESSAGKDTKQKRSRSKSTSRKRSPSADSRSKDGSHRRRTPAKTTKRYTVQCYKYPLVSKSAGLMDLNTRYKSMYVPSDFTQSLFHWQDCFALDNQYITNTCHFQVLHKDVEPSVVPSIEQLHPDDADSSWIARVMLLHVSQRSDMYKDCCGVTQDTSDKFMHPSRSYKFLLGYKGKKEVMAIGGLWSPSLDGPNPESNPQTLIKTAIRTTKELTGIDLSCCTKWYRMLEVRYHRDEEGSKDRRKPERVQTTVIYLPDVHNCMPNSEDYIQLRDVYMNKFTDKYINKPTTTVADDDDVAVPTEDCDITDKDTAMEEGSMTVVDELKGDSDEENEEKPTHYSELDLKSMKVDMLRQELKLRGLETKGLKSQLVVRLQEAIDEEKNKEDEKEVEDKEESKKEEEESDNAVIELDVPENDDKITHKDVPEDKKETKEEEKKEDEKAKQEEEKQKEMDELELKKLKKRYILSSRRSILVHPNPSYKKGTFDCQLTSLHSLMDYVLDDKKESMFEVYLFAECFNEMLHRDHAFNIYKALKYPVKLPEPKPAETGSKRKSDSEDGEPKSKKSKDDGDKKEEEDEKMEESKDDESVNTEKEESKEKSDKDKIEKEAVAKIEKVAEKQFTVRKDLLLSFVYFDQSHTGYIRENDLIDIVNSIGLNLSRSQISKLVSLYMEHGKMFYKKLTDCDESKAEELQALEEEIYENINMEHLVGGNKFLMKTIDFEMNSKKQSGIVSYKGTSVDIEAMLSREKINDKTRSALEIKNTDLKDKLAKLQSSFDKSQNDLHAVEDECKQIGEKLSDSRSKLGSLTSTKDNYAKIFTGMKKLVTEANVEEKAE